MLDYSGRFTERLVRDHTGDLQSIESTTWREAALFDTAVKVYLATDTRTYTCDSVSQALPSGSQELDCKTRGAVKRITRTYHPKMSAALSYSGFRRGDLPAGGTVAEPGPSTIMYVLRGEG